MISIEQILEQFQEVLYKNIQAEESVGNSAFMEYMNEKIALISMIEQYRKEAVPGGWQLVPIDPTDEMIEILADSTDAYDNDARQGYIEMLSAAPKPDSNLPELLKPQSPEY